MVKRLWYVLDWWMAKYTDLSNRFTLKIDQNNGNFWCKTTVILQSNNAMNYSIQIGKTIEQFKTMSNIWCKTTVQNKFMIVLHQKSSHFTNFWCKTTVFHKLTISPMFFLTFDGHQTDVTHSTNVQNGCQTFANNRKNTLQYY